MINILQKVNRALSGRKLGFTPRLRLLIVANNAKWRTWESQISQLRDWFSRKIQFDIDLVHSSFKNIPFEPYNVGVYDNQFGVSREWYDQNITPLGYTYDIVLFVVNRKQWKGVRARGYRTDNDQGPIELQIGCDEKEEVLYTNFDSLPAFFQLARHELCHAMFMMTRQFDMTHFYWDRGQMDFALDSLNFQYLDRNKNSLFKWLQDEVNKLIVALAPLQKQVEELKILEGSQSEDKLVRALIEVESGGNDDAVGDIRMINKAYGPLQIRKPCVTDVNEAFGTSYKAEDCKGNRQLSIEIFKKYMEIWATYKRLGRAVTDEDRARIWNGGPSGHKKASTVSYWNKVKKVLNNLN